MKNLKMKFNKTNSKIFIIAKNIEIIYFLIPELIKKYLAHLKDNLNNNIKEKTLYRYIENYWVNNRGYESLNYYNII
jgi:hypothetical protein